MRASLLAAHTSSHLRAPHQQPQGLEPREPLPGLGKGGVLLPQPWKVVCMENQKKHVVKSATFIMRNFPFQRRYEVHFPRNMCICIFSSLSLSHTLTYTHFCTVFYFGAFPFAWSIAILSQLVLLPTLARYLSRTQK